MLLLVMNDSLSSEVFPRALPAPNTPVTCIDHALISQAIQMSRPSPRKRIILPFHRAAGDKMHRMLNAVQPGSYIRPHRHLHPPKAESVIVLKGTILYVVFNAQGDVTGKWTLSAVSHSIGVDSEPGVMHTFIAMEEDSVMFEVKPGPYDPIDDKDFAVWAPEEGQPECSMFLDKWTSGF